MGEMLLTEHDSSFFFRWENPQTQRYYCVLIKKDMFKTWVVTKIWGGMGKARGRIVHVACVNLEEAQALTQKIADMRVRRGYYAV